jgi:hypothetical protein
MMKQLPLSKIPNTIIYTDSLSGIVLGSVYIKYNLMKKDIKKSTDNKPINNTQAVNNIKNGLPVKNPMTDVLKNTASQTTGLNQAKTTRDDLFPSDGDNLTI